MAKTYKQKLYSDIDDLLCAKKYTRAKVSDALWALEAVAEVLWRALPVPKAGRKLVERTKRYRVI